MPTRKRRIGFIPSFDVLKVIDNISEEEKLSNSKVVNILIEEALYSRGLINKVKRGLTNTDSRNLRNKISDLENILFENDFKFDAVKEEFIQSKNNTKVFKRFVQFLHFKKMMNILEEYD